MKSRFLGAVWTDSSPTINPESRNFILLHAILFTFVLAVVPLSATKAAPVLDQYNYQGTANGPEVRSDHWLSQTFTVGISGLLPYVEVRTSRSVPAPNAPLIIELYATDGVKKPTGTPLASVSIPVANVSGSPSQRILADFSAFSLNVSKGDVLAIVQRTDSALPGSFNWWGRNVENDLYTGGRAYASSDGGSTWGDLPGASASEYYDLHFWTYVEPTYPIPSVTIHIEPDGTEQECSEPGGTSVTLTAEVDMGNIASDVWTIDGTVADDTQPITLFLGLGQHSVQVDVVADNGATGSATETITVADTTAPQIEAAFIDAKTGQEITQVSPADRVQPSVAVTDVCDPEPVINAVVGIPSEHGDIFFTNQTPSSTLLRSNTSPGHIELSVSATDTSGNGAAENIQLELVK